MMLLLALLLCGCGDVDPCEGITDLAETPGGTWIEESEDHPGWGHTACFTCHQTWRIHTHDCIAAYEQDMDAIAEQADPADTNTCVPCHGENGADWTDTDSGATP